MIQPNQTRRNLQMLRSILPALEIVLEAQAAEDETLPQVDSEVVLRVPREWLAEKIGPELAAFLDQKVELYVLRPHELASAIGSALSIRAHLERDPKGAANVDVPLDLM